MLTVQLNFAYEVYLIDLVLLSLEKTFKLKYFSVGYNTIDKSDISNIHNYLMVENNIKKCLGLLNKGLLNY